MRESWTLKHFWNGPNLTKIKNREIQESRELEGKDHIFNIPASKGHRYATHKLKDPVAGSQSWTIPPPAALGPRLRRATVDLHVPGLWPEVTARSRTVHRSPLDSVAIGGAWRGAAPGSPNTLFGTPSFPRILTLALWYQPSQTWY